jgi:hypothetical protein
VSSSQSIEYSSKPAQLLVLVLCGESDDERSDAGADVLLDALADVFGWAEDPSLSNLVVG